MSDENEDDFSGFRERLSGAMAESGITKSELARAIGESPQLLNRWLHTKQQRLPAASYVARLAAALGVNVLWLITGEGRRRSNLLSNVLAPESDLVEIPEFAVTLGAGVMDEPTWEEIQTVIPVAYPRTFFTSRGINPAHCKIMKIHGDSMAPLILDGDRVLIDCEPVEQIHNNGVYAIAYDHQLMAKRLIKDLNRLIIKSVNPDYPDLVLDSSDANRVRILGRILARNGTI